MRLSLKLLGVAGFLIGIAFVVFVVRQASRTESDIILGEREELAKNTDKELMEKAPGYAREIDRKLRLLDYRLAVSYNAEGKPEAAIELLLKLIAKEQAEQRRSAYSLTTEARYQEALSRSYFLRKEEAKAVDALKRRDELTVRSIELRKQARKGEGKYVGPSRE